MTPNGKIYYAPRGANQFLKTTIVDIIDMVGSDSIMPSDLSTLATSNYNRYYNKF